MNQPKQKQLKQEQVKQRTRASFCLRERLNDAIKQLGQIAESTSSSDKVVRLTSSIIKVLKNYQLLAKADRFNSFSKELTQLRRILRMNRISANCRDLKKISEKPTITIRSIYDVIFKLIMMGTDLNDTFVYLMQLKVIPEYQMSNLRQNVLDLYFIECMIWLCQHSYELKTGNFTSEQLYKKILYILKYIIDGITSFNDSSFRSWTLGLKTTSLLSIISSIIGLLIIWK